MQQRCTYKGCVCSTIKQEVISVDQKEGVAQDVSRFDSRTSSIMRRQEEAEQVQQTQEAARDQEVYNIETGLMFMPHYLWHNHRLL